ncbi:MAG: aminotransferase class III-fold pyridoxal phosphate-dependent enzyme [Sphingosinicella sp.]|nr:aminotransferase class III-fold pyridoxal phosphate-dependent enzyme [Sphingosinicella sp.]
MTLMDRGAVLDTLADYAGRAAALLPGGGSHDFRQLEPPGPFMRSGSLGRKRNANGRAVIDLALGNGSLLFGHGYQPVLAAIEEAVRAGLHLSATTEADLGWAEQVNRLVPVAEQIRFTASGNEAVALAVAVARRVTGRQSLISLHGHHFGWVLPGLGVEVETAADPGALAARLQDNGHNYALLLLEPTGAAFGKVPLTRGDVAAIVDAARAADVPVLFDETLTGFRVAPGGAQSLFGLHPDLVVLGKILGAGLPCGALAGDARFMAALDNRVSRPGGAPHVAHGGTHNANPVVAAAGAAMLAALADGKACLAANANAADLRARLNRLFANLGVGWTAYGAHSEAHLFLNPFGKAIDPMAWRPTDTDAAGLLARNAALINALRVALLEGGVDVNGWPGALTASVHTPEDWDRVEAGFARAIEQLRRADVTLTGWGI